MKNPRKLSNAERLDACGDALFQISELRENLRDLWVEGYDGPLDDLAAQLEIMQVALEVAVTSEAQNEADELRREYERGLL